jgi:hypothetical protein
MTTLATVYSTADEKVYFVAVYAVVMVHKNPKSECHENIT